MTLNYDLTHDLDPWFSRSNFEKVITQVRDAWLTWNERDVSRLNVGPMLWLSTLTSPMTWTLNFQRQILKLLYPRSGRVDQHGTKGMWVNRVLYLLCDLELWPWPWIFTVKFKKCCISGMGGPIDMEPKGCESIGCYSYYVTLSYDFDLGFWRSNLKKKLYHRNKRVDWHTRIWIHRMQCWKLSQKVVGPHGLNLKS